MSRQPLWAIRWQVHPVEHATAETPRALRIVAALFLAYGASAVIESVVALSQGRLSVSTGLLGLFIGLGLLRHGPIWRTWALATTGLALLGAPLVVVALVSWPRPLDVRLWGTRIGETSPGVGIVLGVLGLGIAIWQCRVLTQPDVRACFPDSRSTDRARLLSRDRRQVDPAP